MNIEDMAIEAGLACDGTAFDDQAIALFARFLVQKCAHIALANDDLFTMKDILEWYEAAQ